MQQFRNLHVFSTGNNKLEKAKNSLIRVLLNRYSHICIVQRKEEGEDVCHQLLVDWSKKKQLLEKSTTGYVNLGNYGLVLGSERGHEVPQSFDDRLYQLIDDVYENFLVVKLQSELSEKTYYVVADAGRGQEMMASSSEEEIRRCGRILYSSTDEDHPESLVHVIEVAYFNLANPNRVTESEPFEAARKCQLQRVTEYLVEGGDVNSTDKYGWTLLHHAAHGGNIDVIKFLIDKGANVQMQDKMCGRKPVHIAARESHCTAISFLLGKGASINERDTHNWTLLHCTAWKGDLNTVRFLIEHGADVHAEEASESKKPIHVAAEYGHTDVVKLLLENDADIEDGDECGRTPLYYSTWTGHLKTAKFLIGNGARINVKTKKGKTLLHAAALIKSKDIIEFVLDTGLNIDEEDIHGFTPLHYATSNGNLDVVQVLVDRGANLFTANNNEKTPLRIIGKKHVNIVLYLTDRTGKMLQEQDKYNEALQLYKETLEVIEEKLGHNHPETLETQNKVGMMLYELGQYNEAVATLKDVLEKRIRCLGPNHSDTLCTKHELGLVYNAQINFSQALEILKEVFEKRETSLGANHDYTLNVSRDIANVYFKKCEYEEAFEILKDVFEKRSTHFGTDHPKTLQVRQDMAVVLVNKGEYKMALTICKEILEKRKLILGNNHLDTLLTLLHVTLISQKFEKELQQNTCLIQ